jgi:uncharacterized membrane-anchored protein YjiN (DUF445 family)
VHAAAEASMVGAVADWFAVTALFRHPMGIPIPHTALIPRRKDMLAVSLQEFFADNFLNEQVVRARVADAQVSKRIGGWVSAPQHARHRGGRGVRHRPRGARPGQGPRRGCARRARAAAALVDEPLA